MRANAHPHNEARIAALYDYDILDTPREKDFDEIVALASRICETPIAVVNLIDRDRQFFKAEVGIGSQGGIPLENAFCAHALLEEDLMVVPNALNDLRFQDNPLVTGNPHLGFYAGALLKTDAGLPIGSLCVLDIKPRQLNELQLETLRVLARQVMIQLELRRKMRELEAAHAQKNADRIVRESQQAEADRVLAEAQDQFRMVAENIPQLAWMADGSGAVYWYNKRWYDYTGLGDEGSEPSSAHHPDHADRVQSKYQTRIQSGELWEDTFPLRSHTGEYRWFLSRAVPIRTSDGAIVRWFGSNTDISDLVHAREEIESLNHELESRVDQRTYELQVAVHDLEGFNYSIAHDLRAPLRAIVSTSGILLEEASRELSDEHSKLLVRQSYNARRLGTLIDELLQLSRISRTEIARQSVDLTALAHEVVAELVQSGHCTGLKVDVASDIHAEGDPNLLRLVLLNLFDNACKFSPNGGQISFGTRDIGGKETYVVQDHGVGFEMEYAHKLFLPFERLVTEAQFPGTGIGLANVERIITRHGGKVWAESTPGRGSTFYFTLS